VTVAVDTSAAVALVMSSHVAHQLVRRQLRGRDLVLTQHSLAETYSVLTRLPGDARVAADDAVRLLDANFGPPALVPAATAAAVPALLAELAIVGGAVYDGLVGLAAKANDLPLATRDLRAAATYGALGVDVIAIVDDRDRSRDD
jgi:predicted nucleic acid-binding protein